MAADVQEHIRSLGLNRWSTIAYTRDKLLFYLIQRRRAKREKLERQDFTFELAYYLNSYFMLFWGALDQVSWIVNGGPVFYTGRSMKVAHEGLGISESNYEALMQHAETAFDKLGVAEREKAEMLSFLASFEADCVERQRAHLG